MQVPTATLTGIFLPMSTGLRKILLLKPPLRRGRERKAGRGERERRETDGRGTETETARWRREEYRKRSSCRWLDGVMSHRPVILKLPFNIPPGCIRGDTKRGERAYDDCGGDYLTARRFGAGTPTAAASLTRGAAAGR